MVLTPLPWLLIQLSDADQKDGFREGSWTDPGGRLESQGSWRLGCGSGEGDWRRQAEVLSLLVRWAPSTMGKSEVGQGLSSLIRSLESGPAAAPPGSALLSPTWRTCASSFIYVIFSFLVYIRDHKVAANVIYMPVEKYNIFNTVRENALLRGQLLVIYYYSAFSVLFSILPHTKSKGNAAANHTHISTFS